MRLSFILFSTLAVLMARAKEAIYTGSTPAGATVKTFLSIPLTDSVDFIRWELTLHYDRFTLSCNYGIGQSNTNGFVQGGYWVERKGTWKKEKNFYSLQNGDKTLSLFVINSNLLHIADVGRVLLIGDGGWSYTLNRVNPVSSDAVSIATKSNAMSDSMVFQGRTPCFGNQNNLQSKTCYKLKWRVVLFADTKSGKPTISSINGTIFMHNKKTGTWVIVTKSDGGKIYRVDVENAAPFYLLALDKNILVFTDSFGHPLIGNEDFSFTLNRVM